jgi:Thrombospondin type 3 repeat
MREYRSAVISLLLAASLTGCGGGGGGGSNPPPSHGPATPTEASLVGSNAATFSEAFRLFLFDGIATLDENLGIWGGGVPVLSIPDGQQTNSCTVSGSVVLTVNGGGASLTLDYDGCEDDPGLTIDGKVVLAVSNIDRANGTFDFRITYTDLTFSSASDSVVRNGSVTIHTSASGSSHTHALTIDESLDLGTVYSAKGLTATVRHTSGDYYRLEVIAAGGSLDVSGQGSAAIGYLPATTEIHFSGAQSSEAFVTLDDNEYSIRSRDAQGQEHVVSVSPDRIPLLRTLDDVNSPPIVDSIADRQIPQGGTATIDLRGAVFDPDLDPIASWTLTVVSPSSGAPLNVVEVAEGQYEVSGNVGGDYVLGLTVTDTHGASTHATFKVSVLIDTDGDGIFDPSDPDDDNDGVPDAQDAFPLDATETSDADHDGIGDNADPDDDNDGVPDTQDAFPLDPACSSLADSNGQECLSTTLATFDAVLGDGADSLYFVKFADKVIYVWDAATHSFPATWNLGTAVPSDSHLQTTAYVAQQHRLYFGYDSGAITYVDAYVGTEHAFASVPLAVRGLGDAGNFLLAQDESGAWATHYVFAPDGHLTASADWNYYSRVYAFNPARSRVYFFRDDTSPDDLHYEQIDQATGAIAAAGETPYHGAYGIMPPIVPSPAGDFVLIGSGNIFNTNDLTWAGAIPGKIAASVWDAADGLIVLREAGGRTSLERRDAAMQVVEEREFDGIPRGIFRTATGYVVVSVVPERVVLSQYQASNDTDGDGVSNTQDAFPLDPAASIDTDGDGYPDAWNAGYSQTDSTTGLVLDAYPNDAACYLPEHGDGIICDVASTIPSYVPDRVAADLSGTVYLLSAANHEIYRYSAATGQHLSPISVGSAAWLNSTAPTVMEYSPLHGRLYLGYESGEVTYVDLMEPQPRERPFTVVATRVGGIGAAGDYVVIQDDSGAWATHYYYDRNGALRDSAEWNYYSRDYEWNATQHRVYFFRDSQSPDDLHYEEIAADGTITAAGETPYHGDYTILPPIVMSPDDQYVLLGSGDIYRADDLTWYRSLVATTDFVAMIWDGNGTITTVRPVAGASYIDRYDANQQWVSEEAHAGTPLALIDFSGGYLLVTHDGEKPQFTVIANTP